MVIDCDPVAKLKIAEFFLGMFVSDSRKFYGRENFPLHGMWASV